MLYIFNKPSEESIKQFAMLSAEDDEKTVLFVTDGVFLANETNLKRFSDMDVDDFYAAKDAVEAREMEPDSDVEVIDYDKIAGLLEDFETIITL